MVRETSNAEGVERLFFHSFNANIHLIIIYLLHTIGEKLSKSQLQSNTIIKKLRQKEKDTDATISSQKYVVVCFNLIHVLYPLM